MDDQSTLCEILIFWPELKLTGEQIDRPERDHSPKSLKSKKTPSQKSASTKALHCQLLKDQPGVAAEKGKLLIDAVIAQASSLFWQHGNHCYSQSALFGVFSIMRSDRRKASL